MGIVEQTIHLNKFKPREYQLPIFDALENKEYRRVLAILPRRAGKDVCAFNLVLRAALRRIGVYYYIFPTYAQGKKVIWDSITNDGERFLDYIPKELVKSLNSQEMKITLTNGSIIQIVGSDNFDCFDDQTEILTNEGWKLFKDLNQQEYVATLKEGYFVWDRPQKYVEYDYDGELYAVSNHSLDFRVTPNHRFWVKSNDGVYKFKEISDPTIKGYMIPATSKWKGRYPRRTDEAGSNYEILGFSIHTFVQFMGIFLSEGSTFSNHKCYRVVISQTKPKIRSYIKDLLKEMGLNYVATKDGFNIEDKELYEYFSALGKQKERYIPRSIKELPDHLLRTLWSWLLLGDGYEGDYVAYYSISKKLIDDIQEVLSKIGLSSSIYIKKQPENIVIRGRRVYARHTLYEIRVRKSLYKRFSPAAGKDAYIKRVPYQGKVYCVSVPSGVIKVRRNGKEYWSGNSLMGTNPRGVIFSEYSLQDPRAYQYIRPILTANDGWALFLSTPRGKNHLWELYQIALNSPEWFSLKLTIEDTNHIPLSEIEKERAEGIMSEDLIQQEYFTSFTMGVEGAYYAKYIDRMRMKGQIGIVPYEVGFKVHTAWDIGVRDSTCIIFFQVIGQTVRIIDCYEKNKEGLEHYIKVINQKEYTYGRHFAPHDIRVKEWGLGMTRIEKAKQLGLTFTMAPDVSIEDGIESVRSAFSKIWIDSHTCAPLLKALENYRQEYDARKKVYKDYPLHDWSSHYADCMRYLCIALPKTRDGLTPDRLDEIRAEARSGDGRKLPPIFQDNPLGGRW